MAGILANSVSVTMTAGETAVTKAVTGYVEDEEITLSVSPTGTDYVWSITKPSGSTARSDLSSDTGASVTFTPEADGYWMATCVVDSTTTYRIRIAVSAISQTTTIGAHRFSPIADASVPTPVMGATTYYSSDAGTMVEKRSDGTVRAPTTIAAPGAGQRRIVGFDGSGFTGVPYADLATTADADVDAPADGATVYYSTEKARLTSKRADGDFFHLITSDDVRPVSVRDHATSAIGNGENADAALATAQTYARAGGRPLLFTTGRYVITDTLEIDDANAGDINTAVLGEQATYDTVGAVSTRNTIIEWAGTGGNIIRVRSRGVRLEGIALRVQNGKTADAAIVWDKNTQTATRLEVINCQVLAGAFNGLGTCTDGLVIGPTSGINNLDYATVDRCYMTGFTDAAINIKSDTGQSKGHHFSNSVLGVAAYGIRTTSGSFVGFNLHVGYATTASIGLGASTDYIAIHGLDSENSVCALKNIGGYYLPWPVKLSGGRWSLSDTSATHYVDWAYSQLIIENVLMDYAGTFDPTTRGLIRVGGRNDASNYTAGIVSMGNTYLNPTPWRVASGGGTPAYVDVCTFGDYYKEYSGSGPYVFSGNMPAIPATQSLRVDTTGVAETRRNYSVQRFNGSRYEPSTHAVFSGTGSPEGTVTGNPGDEYRNLTGGAGATLWIKESGTATNTGWVAK